MRSLLTCLYIGSIRRSPACTTANHVGEQHWSLQASSTSGDAQGLAHCVSMVECRERGDFRTLPRKALVKIWPKTFLLLETNALDPFMGLFRIRSLSTNVRPTKAALFFPSAQC